MYNLCRIIETGCGRGFNCKIEMVRLGTEPRLLWRVFVNQTASRRVRRAKEKPSFMSTPLPLLLLGN